MCGIPFRENGRLYSTIQPYSRKGRFSSDRCRVLYNALNDKIKKLLLEYDVCFWFPSFSIPLGACLLKGAVFEIRQPDTTLGVAHQFTAQARAARHHRRSRHHCISGSFLPRFQRIPASQVHSLCTLPILPAEIRRRPIPEADRDHPPSQMGKPARFRIHY